MTFKDALKTRFRNEHIARLRNNHIIYPALSKKAYQIIIKNELIKLQIQAKDLLGIHLQIEENVEQMIYKEGVYPTYGTRPLYSTIQSLIEPQLATLPVIIAKYNLDCICCILSYKKR